MCNVAYAMLADGLDDNDLTQLDSALLAPLTVAHTEAERQVAKLVAGGR